MDHDTGDFVPRKGMTIVGSDGETVGEIDLVEANYVIVTKGLFPQDYYIAIRDIAGQDGDDTLRLAIPAQEALDRGLGNPMVGAESERAELVDASATGNVVVEDRDMLEDSMPGTGMLDDVDASRDDTAPTEVVADVTDPAPVYADASEGEPGATETYASEPMAAELDVEDEPVRDDMHRTVTLSAEEVTATTRPVERGVVHVEKAVVEEKVTLEVPLVEDEVHVTRRRVDRDISDVDAPFEESHIEIPLRGQGVEIEKRAHVVEEVDIDKSAHHEIREIHETVRHEEARVEGDDVVDVTDNARVRPDAEEPTTT
jgi:uncharacterized protein (TIGR02271 family)